MPKCTICLDTKFYVNSRGVQTDIPCNECNSEAWTNYIKEKK